MNILKFLYGPVVIFFIPIGVFAALLIHKLYNATDLSWWWVTASLWIYLIVLIVGVLIYKQVILKINDKLDI